MADLLQLPRRRARPAPGALPGQAAATPATDAAQPATPAAAAAPALPGYLQARLAVGRPGDPAAADRDADATTAPPGLAQRLDQRARGGAGRPLPRALRARLAPRLGAPLAEVRLHTDDEAAALCRRVGAQAFTVGAHIYFARGAWDPGSEAGLELLAHELTHVLQQRAAGAPLLARRIDPLPGLAAPPTPDAASRDRLAAVQVLPLPRGKRRHLPVYQAWQQAGRLRRTAGYDREDPRQVSVWNQHVAVTAEAFNQRLRERGIPEAAQDGDVVNLRIGHKTRSRSRRDWLRDLRVPDWDRRGRAADFQVDHIVELQVSGAHGEGVGNSAENMELFDAATNTSSGRTMMAGIRARVRAYRESLPAAGRPPSNSAWLRDHHIVFDGVAIANEGAAESASAWWTRQEVAEAQPLANADAVPPGAIEGSAREFVLASGAGGIVVGRYRRVPDGQRQLTLRPESPEAKRLAGMTIGSIQLDEGIGAAQAAGAKVGTLGFRWDLPADFHASTAAQTIDLLSTGRLHSAAPGPIPALRGDFAPLSPFSFDNVTLRDGELHAVGTILPSLPLLARCRLEAVVQGRDVRLQAVLPVDQLQSPLPGLRLDGGSLRLSYGTAEGFGAAGTLGFSIARLGSGELEAGATQAHGFGAEGRFDFDPALFDRASVRLWYRDGRFGGAGEIGIDSPDKVRGIRSANLAVAFDAGAFSARGTVQPSIPGVQQAGLSVGYAEDQGLTLGGTLQLAPNPALRSGSVEVTVRKPDERWLVRADGQAVPAIPGLDSRLEVHYEDGAFDARFAGQFQRGMLAGRVALGATNRALDAQGRPSGAAAEDAPIVVYGGGSATLRLAPWLQGTAGLRFAPDGEVTVSGEIGLPSALTLFERRQIDRRLFGLAVQVPLVPGIVAEVGGNLSASAGIGPGQLDQLRIGVSYTPSREQDTHVTGDAHLRVPADAGLRLAARAGIGLGITGASATGGIELGGAAGIAGAAEAGVHIDWRPSSGLAIDAEASLHAEPRLRFDVSGYVSVQALGFSVYDQRFELAAFELGSGLRLGLRFPVRYREGQPFAVSADDLQFDVPAIDPVATVRQVLAQVTG